MDTTAVNSLVFDLDNTLLDRNDLFARVAGQFYDEYLRQSASVTRADAVAMMISWDEEGYSNRQGMFTKWLNTWPGAGLNLESLRGWYRSATERQVEPDAVVNEFLSLLNKQQVPWGIVTNGAKSQHTKLRAAGLEELASFIIVSEEVGYEKPDPRIFRDALMATGLTVPEAVLFVGDNPVADIDGAKKFGMKAAWIRRGRQYPADLQQPDYILDHVTEVQSLVAM